MTEKEIMQLPEGTRVRIKKEVECSEQYKRKCFLRFYSYDRNKGAAYYNKDTERVEITYPFGIATDIIGRQGVCYEFTADEYELIE